MNFATFKTNLEALLESIEIASPVSLRIKKAHCGALPRALSLPTARWDLTDNQRVVGFGSRDQRYRVDIQVLISEMGAEDEHSSLKAYEFWSAAKDVFDGDITIGGSVSMSTLQGGSPTAPIKLEHNGKAYVGFSAYLDIQDVEDFTFG